MYFNIPTPFKNKYIIALICFAIWMLFIDRNSIIDQIQMSMELRNIRKEKAYYKNEIAVLDKQEQAISDKRNLEKIAREKYFMKRDNEDLFLIIEK